MRISTSLLYANAARNVNKNQMDYLEAQEVLITQRRINRPSDDPIGAARALDLHKRLARFEQFKRNISQADSFVEQTEIALSSVRDAIVRVRELAIDINGGIANPGEFASAAAEVKNLYEDIVAASNMRIGNRYIFAGFNTTAPPFDAAGVYSGTVGDAIEVEINDGAFLKINFDGDESFKTPVDIFQAVADMEAAILAGDQALISANLTTLNVAMDHVISKIADIGARSNRLENALLVNDEMIEAYRSILSDIEDADIVEASMDFAKAEQVYQATMEVTGRVLRQSFLDFLR